MKEHINEFKRIDSNYDLDEYKRKQEIKNLMKEKIKDFLDNISKVFKKINPILQFIISSFIKDLKDKNVETIVWEMWRNENFGLFEICNAAILTDLYYAVVDTNVIPEFMKHANFNTNILSILSFDF